MVGTLQSDDQLRQTHIRFRKITDYEAYINSIDDGFDAKDAVFNGCIYKLDTPQFNLVNRSQYRNGCDFKRQIIEYRGDNCYIPSNSYCFIKSINYLTNSDYNKQYLDVFRNEKRRSNILTMARIQPCLTKLGDNFGYFNGKKMASKYNRKQYSFKYTQY